MSGDYFEYCFDQVKQGDRDRYLTLLLAPGAARESLAALAAFNLELARTRDQVSESLLGLIRLQWWREAVEEIGGGRPVRQHPVAQALAEATRIHGLDTAILAAMVEARQAELEDTEPPTETVFLARADATAGNLLRLSTQAAGLAAGEIAAAVEAVGRAYAAAGILRSVAGDARRRRVRLPREALAQAGVELDRLFELKPHPALAECARAVAMQAAQHLDVARAERAMRRSGPLVLTARLAGLHLERLRAAAYDPFDPRVIAPHPGDVWRLLWTNLTGRF